MIDAKSGPWSNVQTSIVELMQKSLNYILEIYQSIPQGSLYYQHFHVKTNTVQ